MYMRVHRQANEVVLALCDSELLGKVLREEEIVLDLKQFGEFYKGKKVEQEELAEALGEATSINAVGERSVEAVRNAVGFEEDKVRLVEGVPHVQVYKV
ncbi:DUF424 domain-containing protein [Candidatus Micrarchaeota archaeon]|nr:MAG: DUF424 domain-containing protein [Candidatus Micrarchaeota archaeon]